MPDTEIQILPMPAGWRPDRIVDHPDRIEAFHTAGGIKMAVGARKKGDPEKDGDTRFQLRLQLWEATELIRLGHADEVEPRLLA